MPVSAIGVSPAVIAAGSQQIGGTSSDRSAFTKIVEKFLSDVNVEQVKADHAVERLVTGKAENIHEVMLAMSKADLSFRMFMEVRNRAIDAYQEIMRMQI